MTAALIAEVRCDRCGRFICDGDQTIDQLRATLHLAGWMSEFANYDDLCAPCVEKVEHDMGYVL